MQYYECITTRGNLTGTLPFSTVNVMPETLIAAVIAAALDAKIPGAGIFLNPMKVHGSRSNTLTLHTFSKRLKRENAKRLSERPKTLRFSREAHRRKRRGMKMIQKNLLRRSKASIHS